MVKLNVHTQTLIHIKTRSYTQTCTYAQTYTHKLTHIQGTDKQMKLTHEYMEHLMGVWSGTRPPIYKDETISGQVDHCLPIVTISQTSEEHRPVYVYYECD